MMLDQLGEAEAARSVETAVEQVLAEGRWPLPTSVGKRPPNSSVRPSPPPCEPPRAAAGVSARSRPGIPARMRSARIPLPNIRFPSSGPPSVRRGKSITGGCFAAAGVVEGRRLCIPGHGVHGEGGAEVARRIESAVLATRVWCGRGSRPVVAAVRDEVTEPTPDVTARGDRGTGETGAQLTRGDGRGGRGAAPRRRVRGTRLVPTLLSMRRGS